MNNKTSFEAQIQHSQGNPGRMQWNKRKVGRELLIFAVTCLALYNAGRSIADSVERQFFLSEQSKILHRGQAQAQQINKELREGLANYRSSNGIEHLARERLNQAGPDEVIVHIGK
jgi:cell division protein FtsB